MNVTLATKKGLTVPLSKSLMTNSFERTVSFSDNA